MLCLPSSGYSTPLTTPATDLCVYTLSKILALRRRHVHPTAMETFGGHRLLMILYNAGDYCTFTCCTVHDLETAGKFCVVSSRTSPELLWLHLLAQ